MATMLNKHTNFLSWLVLLVLFAFSKSNALPIKDVYSFCEETSEVDFCLNHIGLDQRIDAAPNFSDVFLIAISETQIQVTNALTRINNIRQDFNDTIGKNRIKVCEEKYEIAANSFQKAWEVGQNKSKSLTMEMSKPTQAGCDAVRLCQDEWSKQGPSQESPLTLYYHNVQKLCQITRVILKKLQA